MLSEEKEILEYIKDAFKLRDQKLYKQAVEMLYKALDMDNDNIEVLFQLGEIYALMHNYERALDYLEQVLEINNSHVETLKLVTDIYDKENNFDKALDYAKELYETNKNAENLKKVVILLGKSKQINDLKLYIDSEDCNSEVLYEIANAMYLNGKSTEAEELLNKNFESDKAKVLLGKIYFNKNELDKARNIFDTFSKTTDDAEVLNYKGLFALEDMDFTEAIKYFSKASSINKGNSAYAYNLGNAYFFNGWMEEAQKAYSKAIYLAPDNLDYRYSVAYLYWETGKTDKCKKEVEAILAINPKHYRTRILEALLLNQNKEYMQAKEILEDNIKNGYEDSFTLTSLTKVYANLDMFEQAEKTIKKVIKNNPDNSDYISDLADVYIQEKEFDKAIELADKNIKENPNYVYGYILGAKASFEKEDFDKAKEFAQEALSLDMNCSDGYYYLAMVRYNEKDYEEAIECMKRAILHNPLKALYYAQMSNIYKAINDVKTALDYISEATDIDNSTEYKIMYQELATLNRKK